MNTLLWLILSFGIISTIMTSIRLMMEKRLLKEFTDIARKTNNAELLTVIREEQAMLQAARSATSQDIARLERLKKELGVDGVNFAEAPPIDPYVGWV